MGVHHGTLLQNIAAITIFQRRQGRLAAVASAYLERVIYGCHHLVELACQLYGEHAGDRLFNNPEVFFIRSRLLVNCMMLLTTNHHI